MTIKKEKRATWRLLSISDFAFVGCGNFLKR